MEKDYKALFLPSELHKEVKKLALENDITMIKMVEQLLENWEKQFVK